MLNTYIYHHLPHTCFSVCYTIFRETIVLLSQKHMLFANKHQNVSEEISNKYMVLTYHVHLVGIKLSD